VSPVFRDVLGFVDAVRNRLLRRIISLSLVWGMIGFAGLGIMAWAATSSGPGGKGGTVVPLLVDILMVGVVATGVWLYRRARVEWVAEHRVTRSIESACGIAPGTLHGSVELARHLPAGVSVGLAEAAARDVWGQLQVATANPEGGLGWGIGRWSRRGWGLLAVLSPVLIAATIVTPDRSRVAIDGLVHPLSALSGEVLPALDVSPGDSEVMRGSDVPLTVVAQARETVTVRWQARGDVGRSQEVVVVSDSAAYVLRGIRTDTEFWVEAPDGARTDRFMLTPVDPLFVSDLTVTLEFPPHTGRFSEEYRGSAPALLIPVGTRVQLRGRASRPLASARLEGDALPSVEFAVEAERFSAVWVPLESGLFRWEFEDLTGARPELQPDPLELTLVSDMGPEITMLMPGRDTVLSASYRQPLVMEATDDYGVDRIELVVYRVSALGARGEPVVQALDIGAARSALVRPVMDLSRWNLLSGDTIRYFARALDNAPSTNIAVTPEFVLRPPSRSDLRKEAGERLEEATADLQRLAEEAADQADEMNDLERQAAAQEREQRNSRQNADDRAEFDEREAVRQSLEEQGDLLSEVDSLSAELDRMREEMQELADPELQRALEELQRLMDEMTPDDLRERVQEMSESLDEMERDEMDDAFQDLTQDQESLRDRMKEALERFKRAAMEQEFRATGQEAEELAQKEDALAGAMEEGDQAELRAEQQAALEAQAEALQDRLEQLSEQLTEQGDPQREQAVEEAAQLGEQARQNMEKAQQKAESGEMQEAAESARKAAEQMDEMAQELQEAQQQMNNEMMEALEQALRQTSNDALALARQQTELREQMRGASQETLAGLRGDEAAILQGVGNMAENLAVMNRITQNDGREIAGQMGQAMDALEQTIAALEDQRGRTPSPFTAAEHAVQGLNQVAMTAMQNAQQLGQSGEGQSSSEQIMEQLEQLAEQQSQLNEQTGEITPMQMGEQAQQQQMEDASESQQDVADELGDLSEEPGSESQSLGDLEQLAREAEALAQMLAGGRLDAELRDRQQRLFHRLLDAGRSLEKDEESEKRESEAPGEFERGTVLPLSAEDLAAFRYRMPSAVDLRALSPAERLMVIQYFERLNRDRARRSGGGR
jgi:hypothetical protein